MAHVVMVFKQQTKGMRGRKTYKTRTQAHTTHAGRNERRLRSCTAHVIFPQVDISQGCIVNAEDILCRIEYRQTCCLPSKILKLQYTT